MMDDYKDLDFDYVGPDEWGTYPEPDEPDDTDCIDGMGNVYAEHDEDSYSECLRCGAELDY